MYGDKMHTGTIKEILNLLREKMKANNVSQKMIVVQLDMSKSAISQMLNGHKKMSLENFIIICDCIGVRPGEILANVGQ